MATLTPPTRPADRSPAHLAARSGRRIVVVVLLGAVLLALVAGAVVALRDDAAGGGVPTELMERGFAVWAEDDAAGLRELYADDVVFVQADGRSVTGTLALEAFLPTAPTPVRTGGIVESGPFAAAPYTYEEVPNEGILVIEVEDGRIARQQLFEDRTP